MENEFNSNLEHEFDDGTNIKSLEEFFSKEINTSLTPQEVMIVSLSLYHVASLLNIYRKYTDLAVFDVKEFTTKHPEYSDVDFNNLGALDNDTIETISNLLHSENEKNGEEFDKGNILMNSIITVLAKISSKLYDSYTRDYGNTTPKDTVQFFTMLENCLQNSITLLQKFFTQNF